MRLCLGEASRKGKKKEKKEENLLEVSGDLSCW